MGGGQSGLPLWVSFDGEGAAGRGKLGQGRVAVSLVAPLWFKPCADVWIGSGGGCQGARGTQAPGEDLPYKTSMVRVEGREGWQHNYAIAVGSRPIQPLSTEETSRIQFFWLSRSQGKLWKSNKKPFLAPCTHFCQFFLFYSR